MKPKLLLHTGTPKTGTKTVQSALHASRSRLLREGILYPDVDLSFELKHQWMVNLLMAGDLDGFRRNLQTVVDTARAVQARQVVLSTEGLFLHWTDFTEEARHEIGELAAAFDVTVWTVFREPLSFAISLYSQVLKNPPSPHLTPCYATTLSFEDAVRDPWFAARLDYGRFIVEIEQLFGRSCLVATQYESADTVAQVRALLGVDASTLPAVPNRNQGLNTLGAELLRRLNELPLDLVERQRLVDAVVEVDQVLGRGQPLAASAEAERTVEGWSRPSVQYLGERFGVHWSPRSSLRGPE